MFIGLVDHIFHTRTKTFKKIAFKQVFSQTIVFLDIFSQNCAKASQIFQNIAKLKSITMHMISDFMHFDTVAFRPKKCNLKSGRL